MEIRKPTSKIKRERKMKPKNKIGEIQMFCATTEKDIERIKAITKRLTEIIIKIIQRKNKFNQIEQSTIPVVVDYPKNHNKLYWRKVKKDPPPLKKSISNEKYSDLVLFFNGYVVRLGYMKKDNRIGISTYDENDNYMRALLWMPIPLPPKL